jgi:hypothetical protein
VEEAQDLHVHYSSNVFKALFVSAEAFNLSRLLHNNDTNNVFMFVFLDIRTKEADTLYITIKMDGVWLYSIET